MQSYRPEIDGLRAVAVLPVILFHAGVSFLSGGFLGVDVFFVISGYLITKILLKELQTGQFSILSFYERRARRILPALLAVILLTIPFAWALMPPDALQTYFRSIPATAWFASNIHFYQSQGYFSPDADLQPLLHTWSLAVEEQFYLIFPLLLALLWWLSNRITAWLAALSVVGFCVCVWQLSKNESAAFYLPHARFWELLSGAVLAAAHSQYNGFSEIPKFWRTFSASLSAILLVLCFVSVDESWSTPGFPNMVVVIASMSLLAFTNVHTGVGKILASRPFVAIGLISYSAYLWHHPLFAFARLGSLNQPSTSTMLSLALLSLILAYFSWTWIEQPFRKKALFSRNKIFSAALSFMLVAGLAGYIAVKTNLATAHYSEEQLALVSPTLSNAEKCKWINPVPDNAAIKICGLGTFPVVGPVVLWGDSHAQALLDQFARALTQRGRGGFYLNSSPCLRIPGILPTSRLDAGYVADCDKAQAAMFAYLAKEKPSSIVVSMRWTLRLFPVSGAEDSVGFDNGEGGVESEDKRINWVQDEQGKWTTADEFKSAAIISFLRRLGQIAPVIVVGPVPEVGWHVGHRNFKSLFIARTAPEDISTDYIRFTQRNAFILQTLDEAERQLKFLRIEPSEIFCNRLRQGRCVAQLGRVPYYADNDHVSAEGAALIVQELIAKLPEVPAPKP